MATELSFLFVFLIIAIIFLVRFLARTNSIAKEFFALLFVCILSCALVFITPEVIHIPIIFLIFILPVILAGPFLICIFFIIKKSNKNIKKTSRKNNDKYSEYSDIWKQIEK